MLNLDCHDDDVHSICHLVSSLPFNDNNRDAYSHIQNCTCQQVARTPIYHYTHCLTQLKTRKKEEKEEKRKEGRKEEEKEDGENKKKKKHRPCKT